MKSITRRLTQPAVMLRKTENDFLSRYRFRAVTDFIELGYVIACSYRSHLISGIWCIVWYNNSLTYFSFKTCFQFRLRVHICLKRETKYGSTYSFILVWSADRCATLLRTFPLLFRLFWYRLSWRYLYFGTSFCVAASPCVYICSFVSIHD